MEHREGNSFEKWSNAAEKKLPLLGGLYADVEYLAYEYDMRPKDVLRQFLKLGLKCNKAIERGTPRIFLISKNDKDLLLVPEPKFPEKDNFDSIIQAPLILYPKESKELNRIAREKEINTGQVFDGFVEMGLDFIDLMEDPDYKIVFRDENGEDECLIFLPTRNKQERKEAEK